MPYPVASAYAEGTDIKDREAFVGMTPADILKREVKVLTFDLYGTVVDMQFCLTEAVTPFLKKKGMERRAAPLRYMVAAHPF